MDNSYIIIKRCKFNNNITETFSQEKIIQKWTFKTTIANHDNNKQSKKQNTNNKTTKTENEIQLSLNCKLEFE